MLKYDQHLLALGIQFTTLLGDYQHNFNQHVDKRLHIFHPQNLYNSLIKRYHIS